MVTPDLPIVAPAEASSGDPELPLALPASLTAVEASTPGAVLAPVDLPITEALVVDWLADLERRIARGQRSPITHANYGRAIRPWLAFLATEARTDAPTPSTVLAYQEAGYQRGLQPGTVNVLVATVASLYRFAERTDRYPSIARSIERIREQRDGPLPCLSSEQIAALQTALDAAIAAAAATPEPAGAAAVVHRRRLSILRRNRALVAVLAGTGIRLVSLVRASIADVDLVARELRHQPKRHRAKDVVAFLSRGATAALSDYLADRQANGDDVGQAAPLFAAHDRRSAGARLTTRSMSRIVLDLLVAHGHVQRDPAGHIRQPRRLTAHGLRRSAAKRVYERYGAEVASQLLGHASVATTMASYARIKRDADLRRAADDA